MRIKIYILTIYMYSLPVSVRSKLSAKKPHPLIGSA